ncbi:MAG: ABC transporter permease [Oscillospiraceae bacterium]|jgi:ABC-2 type transport system permease protein|nr:ABC transporter permease [Oscillospiraceae bacterium]
MKSASAIFGKQLRDTFKNRMVLIQFIVFPMMAFLMTELVAKADDTIPNSMFVTMFAAMFVGMTPLMMNAAIAEDREHKSLRFLIMAGVKPWEYLLGIGGFVLLMSSLVSVIFGLISGFAGMELIRLIAVLIIGSIASALLGATIGIASKNQQAATALGTPVFMVLAFSPMIAQFNETVEKVASVFYTQQVNILVNNASANALKPFLIIAANIAVLVILFMAVYKKKGLKA